MANQYANKVVVNGRAIIDLTGDTVAPESLLEGIRAHDSSGAPIIGTAKAGGDCIAWSKTVELSGSGTKIHSIASIQELVDAGFITNEETNPGQLWNYYVIILVRKSGSTLASNAITESRVSSYQIISTSSRLYYKNALRVSGTSYTALGSADDVTKSTSGYMSIGSGGLVASQSSTNVYNGTFDLLIFASGKK